MEWDSDFLNVKLEKQWVRWISDESGVSKKHFRVDLTSRSAQLLRDDGSPGDLVPSLASQKLRGTEIANDGVRIEIEPSTRGQGGPLSTIMRTKTLCLAVRAGRRPVSSMPPMCRSRTCLGPIEQAEASPSQSSSTRLHSSRWRRRVAYERVAIGSTAQVPRRHSQLTSICKSSCWWSASSASRDPVK